MLYVPVPKCSDTVLQLASQHHVYMYILCACTVQLCSSATVILSTFLSAMDDRDPMKRVHSLAGKTPLKSTVKRKAQHTLVAPGSSLLGVDAPSAVSPGSRLPVSPGSSFPVITLISTS